MRLEALEDKGLNARVLDTPKPPFLAIPQRR